MKEISFEALKKEPSETASITKNLRGPSSSLPPIRTFSRDVESLVREGSITKTQVVMAEATRRESRGEERTLSNDDSHLTRIIFFLLLILAFGVGVGLYVLIGTTPKTDTVAKNEVPKTERMYEVNISNAPREQIIADMAVAFSKTSYNPNESRIVAFTSTDGGGAAVDATTQEFFAAIASVPPPEMLMRALGEKLLFRVHGETITSQLIGSIEVDVRSYRNAFAGMLEWENALVPSLTLLLDPKFSRKVIESSRNRPFTDEREGGVDMRVLRTAEGYVALAYVFVDENRLIIAGKRKTILDVIAATQSKKRE